MKHALLTILLAAAALRAAADPLAGWEPPAPESILTAPAAPMRAMAGGPAAPGYDAPLSGEWVEGRGVHRRATLLNPRLPEGAPLRLRIEFENRAAEKQEMRGQLLFGYDLIVRVTPPRTRPFEYKPIAPGAIIPTTVLELAPGEINRRDWELLADPETVSGALFDWPGVWTVDVAMRALSKDEPPPHPVVVLGSFPVEVLPASGDDAAARKILGKDPSSYLGIMAPNQMTPRHYDLVRQAAEAGPSAMIAPRLLFTAAFYETLSDDTRAAGLARLEALATGAAGTPVCEDVWVSLLNNRSSYKEEPATTRLFNRIWSDPVLTQVIPRDSPTITDRLGPSGKGLFDDETALR
ncbi:MAG: hypothetical protein SF028_14080 [Candidatus Sumerlaeia bacterium]|nr:hypothetical protein [Candidatus Sumerlaeia bacterium]